MDMPSDAPQPLSIGAVVESSPENAEWRSAIRQLTIRVDDAQASVVSSLNLNIVFHVPGRTFKPEFSGVRTGRFSKRDNELMLQVALPESQPPDSEAYVRGAAIDAIDEAERWAIRRGVAADLAELRSIVLSL
jgi:hypothetical protein